MAEGDNGQGPGGAGRDQGRGLQLIALFAAPVAGGPVGGGAGTRGDLLTHDHCT